MLLNKVVLFYGMSYLIAAAPVWNPVEMHALDVVTDSVARGGPEIVVILDTGSGLGNSPRRNCGIGVNREETPNRSSSVPAA
jgi:hypothetical protein